MITYEILLNKTYKNSCKLIVEKIKGNSIHIDSNLKIILIDNLQPKYEWYEIYHIRFKVRDYYQVIYINPRGNIEATNIEYTIQD